MKKIMVYSHDTFGLGNIRRMLSICTHLIDSIPDLLILLVSGSPMIHSFRIPQRLDYIKLPCLRRDEAEGYSVKFLNTEIDETMKLRSDLILTALANFKPDLLFVDKKPYGVNNELKDTLIYLKTYLPQTKTVLFLRDILDSPETTSKVWERNKYHEAIQSFYDLVLVLGMPEIFDPRKEYLFPASVSEKVKFCGYIQKVDCCLKDSDEIRNELQLNNNERFILATTGGGEDGYHLLETYITGLDWLPTGHNVRSLITCGPEMPELQKKKVRQATAMHPHVRIYEFTDNLMNYMKAADVVVSMGGYNTVCEILSLRKRAIVVPRVKPVEEQRIRAERMARLGHFKYIHPDHLSPYGLIHTLLDELNTKKYRSPLPIQLDLGALPRITHWTLTFLFDPQGALETDPDRQECLWDLSA